jgi:hypothetical protein
MAVTTDTPLAWKSCHDAPQTADSTPYDVDTVTSSTTHYVETPGLNVVSIRLRRASGDTITEPKILAYGKDITGDWRRLEIRPNNGADGVFEATMTRDDTKDLDAGVFRYTKPQEIIVQPVEGFQIHILTAVTGATTPIIQRRLY